MAKIVFVDFETFAMPGSPDNIWQFAYGYIDTLRQGWFKRENQDFFYGVIDWTDRDLSGLSPKSVEFTNTYTPQAFDWVKGVGSPYPLFTLEAWEEETINWFKSRGMYPGGPNELWSMFGRNPGFDYHCFSERIRREISLTPFQCQDVAAMFPFVHKRTEYGLEENYKGGLAKMDRIHKFVSGVEHGTAHDALKDVQDEIDIALGAWVGVNKHFAKTK